MIADSVHIDGTGSVDERRDIEATFDSRLGGRLKIFGSDGSFVPCYRKFSCVNASHNHSLTIVNALASTEPFGLLLPIELRILDCSKFAVSENQDS